MTNARGFNSTSNDSQFQRDRARIIHCASFRSLQSKTQVLGLGESDFYRTRLTHSLEVAQIGSGICEWLRDQSTGLGGEHEPHGEAADEVAHWIPSFSLIEAICLAHDIGHSPFGHGGEVALNFMMKDHGGFEANGQTLRILARLGEYSPDCGLDLTRRTTLGTIKYPVFYTDTVNYAGDERQDQQTRVPNSDPRLNIDKWSPPKCLYDEERDVLSWMLEPFNKSDATRFVQIERRKLQHHRSVFKTFDTSIMELADDIAYGVHDLEDALALGLVNPERWRTCVAEAVLQMSPNPVRDQIDFYTTELFSSSNKQRKHAISKLVGYFIRNIFVDEDKDFEHPLLRNQARMQETAYEILLLLKNFVMQEVILRPELQTLQYKGQQVVIRLFEIFAENPQRLLPRDVYARFNSSGHEDNYRAIADFLCNMTDVSAGRLYHKLVNPAAGSIFDRT